MCHLMTMLGIPVTSHPDAARALAVAIGLGLMVTTVVIALGAWWGDIMPCLRSVLRDIKRMCGRRKSSAQSASVHARRLSTNSCLDTARGGDR